MSDFDSAVSTPPYSIGSAAKAPMAEEGPAGSSGSRNAITEAPRYTPRGIKAEMPSISAISFGERRSFCGDYRNGLAWPSTTGQGLESGKGVPLVPLAAPLLNPPGQGQYSICCLASSPSDNAAPLRLQTVAEVRAEGACEPVLPV